MEDFKNYSLKQQNVNIISTNIEKKGIKNHCVHVVEKIYKCKILFTI